MSGADLTRAENEILGVLRQIYPLSDNFVLIGGYAADAYSPLPRYSVDCDIVITQSNLQTFTTILEKKGFSDRKVIYRNDIEGIKTLKLKKQIGSRYAALELLTDGAKCRQTGAVWSYSEIKESSEDRVVLGVTDSARSRVARRELLIAMKLHSGRGPDLRDVVMMVEDTDWKVVEKYAKKGDLAKVVNQLDSAVENLSKEEFLLGLKAAYSSKSTEDKRVKLALTGVTELKLLLGNG